MDEPKFYVERWTLRGWIRITSAQPSLMIAENLKESLALRYHESVENFSILVCC